MLYDVILVIFMYLCWVFRSCRQLADEEIKEINSFIV